MPEDEDDKIDRELEETMKRMAKDKKRREKKEKVLADKSELRKKMSVIATTTLDNDEDLALSSKLWDSVRQKGFDGVGDKSDDETSEEDGKSEREASDFSSDEEEEDAVNSDESIDEKEARVTAMADQMEDVLKNQQDYQMIVDRKEAGR